MTTSTRPKYLTTPRIVLVAGLLLAAAGILIQFVTGVPGFPAIPPGPIILGAGAVVVALVRWRWIPAVGVVLAAFVTVGMIAAGTGSRLIDPTPIGHFVGTWLQLIGLIVALVAGVVALVVAYPRRR